MTTHYLDFDRGSNGNGTVGTPWNSFTSAQNGIVRGDTVMVSGLLRGEMVFDPTKGGASPAAKTKWLGTVDNPFIVSGGEILSGWVQCTAADLADVGSNYASVWKTSLPKSSFVGSSPWSGNVCELNQQLPIATSRADTSDKFFLTKPGYYWQATAVITSGTGTSEILNAVSRPALTDLFTKTQLERGRLQVTARPNVGHDSTFTYNTTTKFMTITNPARYATNVSLRDSFAIANLLPTIKRGEWGFIDNGTTVTVYVWPQNLSSLAGGIEYSPRDVGIDIGGTSNIEIGYFKVRQVAGAISASGNLFNHGSPCSDVYLHNFESTDTYNDGGMQAAVYMSEVSNCEMAYFDIRRAQRAFGIFSQGAGANEFQAGGPSSVLQMATGGYIHHYTAAFCSSAAHRLFIVGNHVNAFGIFWECAKQSHGNTMNAYQSSHNHLWWGIDGEDSDGYYTWQEADSIMMMFCSASASLAPSGGARGITHQNFTHRNVGSVFGYKPAGVINCSTTPNPAELSFSNSLMVGDRNTPNDRAYVYNNVHHGTGSPTAVGYAADAATLLDIDHNVATNGVARGANDVLVSLDATYENAAAGDFRIKAGSIVRTKPGEDLTAIIAALKIRFPQVPDADWSKDMVGDTFDAAAPGVGPTVNKDAPRGQDRGITYAGIVGGSDGGGGGEPTRPIFNPGFKIKVA